MSKSSPPLTRFLIRPQYSFYYRRLRRFNWTSETITDYGVLFLLSGNVQVEGETGTLQLREQQSLLLAPGIPTAVNGQRVESLLITFSPAFIVDYAARARLVSGVSAPTFQREAIENDSRLSQLLVDLASEVQTDEAGKEIIVAALIEQLAVHLLRRYSKMRRSEELELSRVGLVDRRIRRAIEFMEGHLEQDLSLKQIAAASYLSPFHFARLFKKLTGITPHAYLGV